MLPPPCRFARTPSTRLLSDAARSHVRHHADNGLLALELGSRYDAHDYAGVHAELTPDADLCASLRCCRLLNIPSKQVRMRATRASDSNY